MNSNPSSRPTVGLLLSRLAEKVQTHVWHGIAAAAEEFELNLICIAGRSLQSPFSHDRIHNNLFELAQVGNLDGILWMSGCVANFVTIEEYYSFLERFKGMPQVSLFYDLEGIPSVVSDNASGLREAVLHLNKVHGCRRIAMIKGPEGHLEAQTRFYAYCKTLEELGTPYDPLLVAPGNFNHFSVSESIAILLDHRKVSFDGMVVANDEMASAASNILQERGYRVPEDIAIIGFDDSEDAISASPSLTTIRQPLFEVGHKGVEIMAAQLRGTAVPQCTILPTRLVIRRSCGCYSQTIKDVDCLNTPMGQQSHSEEHQRTVVVKLTERFKSNTKLAENDWITRLVDAIFYDLQTNSETFLTVLGKAILCCESSTTWQKVLSELRAETLSFLHIEEIIALESTLQKARILLGEAVNEAGIRDRLRIESQSFALSETSHGLMTALNFSKMEDALADTFPSLTIPRCFLVLFSGSGSPPEESRLVIAYGPGQDGFRDISFLTKQWIPEELWPRDQRFTYIVEALHFQEEMLGYVIFEKGPLEGAVYEALAGQISTSVKGALLYEERNRTEAALGESQRVLSTMMSNLPGMAYRCKNDADWSMEFVSEGCQQLTGYSPKALVGNAPAFTDLIHPEDLESTAALIRTALATDKPFQITYRIINASGETRWVWEQGRGVRGGTGENVAFEGLIIDVTERRRAEEELTLSMDKLRQSLESTLMAMALTVEIRDPYTAGHQRRVAQLAQAIAEEMGLSSEECHRIRLAAGIHDLGKIRIPAEILSKPGKITPLEFRLIQTHPEVGHDILKTMEFPWPIEQIVLQHHERLDGSGYPHHLRGEEIIPEARILAVADVVEAMSSHRPYRPALGIEQALKEIVTQNAILYDRLVVQACLILFNEKGFVFEAP